MQVTTQETVQQATGVLMVLTDLIPLEITLQHTTQVTMTHVHTMMAEKQALEAYAQLLTIVLKDQKLHSSVLLGPMDLSQSWPSV